MSASPPSGEVVDDVLECIVTGDCGCQEHEELPGDVHGSSVSVVRTDERVGVIEVGGMAGLWRAEPRPVR
jgi:hypothetical protein